MFSFVRRAYEGTLDGCFFTHSLTMAIQHSSLEDAYNRLIIRNHPPYCPDEELTADNLLERKFPPLAGHKEKFGGLVFDLAVTLLPRDEGMHCPKTTNVPLTLYEVWVKRNSWPVRSACYGLDSSSAQHQRMQQHIKILQAFMGVEIGPIRGGLAGLR